MSNVYLYSVPEHDAIKIGHARNPSSSARIYSQSYGFKMPEDIQRWRVSGKGMATIVEEAARKNLLRAMPRVEGGGLVELRGHNALGKAIGGSRTNQVTLSRELLLRPRGLSLDQFDAIAGCVIENLLFHHREWGISLDKSQPGLKERIIHLVTSLHGDANSSFFANFLFMV